MSGSSTGFARWLSMTSHPHEVFILNVYGERAIQYHFPVVASENIVIVGVRANRSLTEHTVRIMNGGSTNTRFNIEWADFNNENGGKGNIRYQSIDWGYLFRSKSLEGVNNIGFDENTARYVVFDGNVFTQVLFSSWVVLGVTVFYLLPLNMIGGCIGFICYRFIRNN